MRSHVALLRGINAGGHNKVPMKALAALVSSRGHGEVETYIQSGNVVFASGAPGAGPVEIEEQLEEVIESELGIGCAVVVVTKSALEAIVSANPFPAFQDPRHLHAVFRSERLERPDRASVEALVGRARAKASPDQASVVDRTVYVWTPGGYGRSELAGQLWRSDVGSGTARNWATVQRLVAMLAG
jgi:uncharacterized protein (DUF1697 family)